MNKATRNKQGNSLSVVIITCNEERNIVRCIESVKGLSDDIIVVDSGSTDATQSLAAEAGARVFVRKWDGYASQKNFGNEQAQNQRILSLDADEVVSAKLAKSIKKVLIDHSEDTLFALNILNNFEGKFIYHGGWYPDWHNRIFTKGAAQWTDYGVHETLDTCKNAKVMRLKGDVLHYTAPGKVMFREKMKHYAMLFARNRFENGVNYSSSKKYVSAVFRFMKEYVFKMGFLDGKAGWNIVCQNTWYTYLKYDYLENLYRMSLANQN